jgi:CheY-like chemotaxis protein
MKTHVLLVDDDIDEMKTFLEALKTIIPPCKCTYAPNGIHALKMLLYLRPEVIFVDYEMPLMDGLELIEKLKAIDEIKQVPVFLYSSNISPAVKAKAEQLGVAGYLEKPACIHRLTEELRITFAKTG